MNKVRNPVFKFMDAVKKIEENEKKKYDAFVERMGIHSYETQKQSKPYLFPNSKQIFTFECPECGEKIKVFEDEIDFKCVCGAELSQDFPVEDEEVIEV